MVTRYPICVKCSFDTLALSQWAFQSIFILFLSVTSPMVGLPAKEKRRKEREKRFAESPAHSEGKPLGSLGSSGFCVPLGEGGVGREEGHNIPPPNKSLWILITLNWRHWRDYRSRKGSLPPLFYLQAVHKIPYEIGALPVPGREHSYHRRLGLNHTLDPSKQTYQNNSDLQLVSSTYFPATVPQFPTPASLNPFSLVLPLLHKFIFLC